MTMKTGTKISIGVASLALAAVLAWAFALRPNEVIGISSDDLPTQCEFAQVHGVKFPMLADPDRAIARRYDVLFMFLPVSHRVTYVLDRTGVIAGVFNHEFAVLKHLDEVLRFVHKLAGPASSRR